MEERPPRRCLSFPGLFTLLTAVICSSFSMHGLLNILSQELCSDVCPVKIRHWRPSDTVMAAGAEVTQRRLLHIHNIRDFVFLPTLEQSQLK